jgi:hypothetical protein
MRPARLTAITSRAAASPIRGTDHAKKLADSLLEMQRSWFTADKIAVSQSNEPVNGWVLQYMKMREKQLWPEKKDSESGQLKRPAME